MIPDKHTVEVIINQFGLDKFHNNSVEASDFGLKDLEKLLSIRIKYLINYDRDKLMTTLYRIDIDENSVKKIFKHSESELIPLRIARLIILRVADKVKNYKI